MKDFLRRNAAEIIYVVLMISTVAILTVHMGVECTTQSPPSFSSVSQTRCGLFWR